MRALNHVHSIPAAAHHEHAVTCLYLRPMTRRSDTCWHATGNEAAEIQRDVLIDHYDRGLIHHGVFGKSTNHAKGADGNAFAITSAVCAVELWSLGYARTFSAKMM